MRMRDKVENEKEANIVVQSLTSSLEKSPELVLSWLSSLTDLEQIVVSLLFQQQRALPIKKIRQSMIINSILRTRERNSFYNDLFFNFPFKSYLPLSNEKKKQIENLPDLKSKLGKIREVKKIPSFRRIENAIQDLKNLRIIFERSSSDLEDKKVKGLYFLNPIIRTQLDKIKEQKIKHREDYKRHIDKLNAELIKAGSYLQFNY